MQAPRTPGIPGILVTLVLACCGTACHTPPADDGSAAAEIEAVLRTQEAAWNQGDIVGFMEAGYWNSEDLTFLSGGSWTRGFEPVLERYRSRYLGEGQEMGGLTFSDLEIVPLSNDLGLARGRWALTLSDGTDPGGLFTLVLRRLPEGWRVVHDHTSVDSGA